MFMQFHLLKGDLELSQPIVSGYGCQFLSFYQFSQLLQIVLLFGYVPMVCIEW